MRQWGFTSGGRVQLTNKSGLVASQVIVDYYLVDCYLVDCYRVEFRPSKSKGPDPCFQRIRVSVVRLCRHVSFGVGSDRVKTRIASPLFSS